MARARPPVVRNAFVNDLPAIPHGVRHMHRRGNRAGGVSGHLLKADQFIRIATVSANWKTSSGRRAIRSCIPSCSDRGGGAFQAALAAEPGLREHERAREWVGDWNLRFAAVLQDREFSHLTL